MSTERPSNYSKAEVVLREFGRIHQLHEGVLGGCGMSLSSRVERPCELSTRHQFQGLVRLQLSLEVMYNLTLNLISGSVKSIT